jgi:peroxidase
VLLASTDDKKAERDAEVNLSLAGDGFDAVAKAKQAVEETCPGIVSCADLLAIATRDLIGLVKLCSLAC